ncbi:hypothetical protein H8S95_15470 [Pontibacter sp. KCTC 32443]|uniref:hypothetical protein n=1 Tax=Pontibacter TaxID=323449 RepID=UPI00164D1571|nr:MULTISPECIES: hypothetical protein [Pontibacter]MBC5775476.1 hypothetical protein [Pontibacter sp. KCTC 32443]
MKRFNGKLMALCAAALVFYGCEKEDDLLDSAKTDNQGTTEECDVITFEGYSGYVDQVTSEGGLVTVNLAGLARNENDVLVEDDNRAMIFDSENWTGDDDDLATTDWGNVLITQQLGFESEPNDNQWGADMRITFTEAVTLESMRILDIDPYENDSWAFVYVAGQADPIEVYLEPHGDNVGFTVDFGGIENVVKLVLVYDGDGPYGSGAVDDIRFCIPGEEVTGCTRTQGYWKTHSGYKPKGNGNGNGNTKYDDTWDAYLNSTLTRLGSATYREILWMEPRGGNADIILAHQFIAAELNVAAGASIPQDVLNAWLAAQAYLNGDTTATREQILMWAEILDDYNNGLTGPGHCDD